jgi:hypothetical protein
MTMARGTGIRFHPGTPTQFNGGSARFNPEADPYDATGDRLLVERRSQVWADRYTGGDVSVTFNEAPWQPEWMMWMGAGLADAAAGKIPLPAGAYREPGEWDGIPTERERADAEYMVTADWLREVVFNAIPIEKGDGKSPGTAMSVNRPTQPLKYFLEQHPRFGYTLYFENTAPGATGFDPRWPVDQRPGGGNGEAEKKLATAKAEAEAIRTKLPTGGGLPMQKLVKAITSHLDKISTLSLLVTLVLLTLTLSGCGTSGVLRTLFTDVSSADAEFSGVKSGPAVSAASTINPDAGRLSSILTALGQDDPLSQYLGVVMPVLLLNETEPRWILCADKLIKKCQGIPLNAKVQFSGKAIGPGLLWRPSRLTAEGYDD